MSLSAVSSSNSSEALFQKSFYNRSLKSYVKTNTLLVRSMKDLRKVLQNGLDTSSGELANKRGFSNIIICNGTIYGKFIDPLRSMGKIEISELMHCFLLNFEMPHVSIFTSPKKHDNPSSVIEISRKEKKSIRIVEWLREKDLFKKTLDFLGKHTSLNPSLIHLISEYAIAGFSTNFPFLKVTFIVDSYKRIVSQGETRMEFSRSVKFIEHSTIKYETTDKKPFSFVMIARVLKEGLRGLELLHENGFIHGNINPGSLCYGKLGGLGYITKIPEGVWNPKYAIEYGAPELHGGLGTYKGAVDIWAIGATAFYMATGKYIYEAKIHSLDLLKGESLENIRIFKDFIRNATIFSPFKRPTATALKNHPFLTQLAKPSSVRKLF